MAKRKHEDMSSREATAADSSTAKIAKTNGHLDAKTATAVIQIIAGSYERVLHGIAASLSENAGPDGHSTVQFADTFMFNAHASAIRCLALSPLTDPESSEAQGVYLATGGTDERVNMYHLSASPALDSKRLPSMPSLGNNKIHEDPRNRELGSIMQHSSSITALHFPTRSKLLSASEDNTIAISKTKDLNVVSTVKAPRPKVQGQPSGDTAPPGATPAGVNDFAVHPSMKLMLSVGRGERCMRLWNLVTGKKAGVLNFGKELLQSVREGKYSSGEGRKIRWSSDGTEYAVAFERGAVVFGADSKAKSRILPHPLTKLHQIAYVNLSRAAEEDLKLLLVSTEDGRILFYCMDKTQPAQNGEGIKDALGDARLCAQLGGKSAGISGRIKDFELIQLQGSTEQAQRVVVVTAGSDGVVNLWEIPTSRLVNSVEANSGPAEQVGNVIGSYETGSRVTCLKAFLMQPARDDAGLSEFEGLTEEGEDMDSASDSDE